MLKESASLSSTTYFLQAMLLIVCGGGGGAVALYYISQHAIAKSAIGSPHVAVTTTASKMQKLAKGLHPAVSLLVQPTSFKTNPAAFSLPTTQPITTCFM